MGFTSREDRERATPHPRIPEAAVASFKQGYDNCAIPEPRDATIQRGLAAALPHLIAEAEERCRLLQQSWDTEVEAANEAREARYQLEDALRSIAGKERPSGEFCQQVARAALESLDTEKEEP